MLHNKFVEPTSHPFPPAELRQRVTGHSDQKIFDESGARTVDEWIRALVVVGKKFEEFCTVVDFGCGCGRSLRHLEPKLASSQRLIGLDVDEEAIAWVGGAFPGISAMAINEPPVAIPSGNVDLILSHSVFTHLPEDLQFRWLAELSRLLKKDGILVASVHGSLGLNGYRKRLTSLGNVKAVQYIDANMLSKGFHYLQGRTELEKALPEYYGTAFHRINYICDNWLNSFTLLAWLPAFALKHQDVLVLRKN